MIQDDLPEQRFRKQSYNFNEADENIIIAKLNKYMTNLDTEVCSGGWVFHSTQRHRFNNTVNRNLTAKDLADMCSEPYSIIEYNIHIFGDKVMQIANEASKFVRPGFFCGGLKDKCSAASKDLASLPDLNYGRIMEWKFSPGLPVLNWNCEYLNSGIKLVLYNNESFERARPTLDNNFPTTQVVLASPFNKTYEKPFSIITGVLDRVSSVDSRFRKREFYGPFDEI